MYSKSTCAFRALIVCGIIPLFLACGSVRAAVLYVNKNAAGTVHDGKSWSTAFTAVQNGVNAATSGDEVWVATSVPAAPAYIENITVPDGVELYGGFSGVETLQAQRDWRIHPTTLDGNNDDVVGVHTDGFVDGFTIRNGGNYGAVTVYGRANIANSTITGNNGSGVLVWGTTIIHNCTITGNRYSGVEVYGTAIISNNIISNCGAGGVLVTNNGTATITNNAITGNNRGVYVHGKATLYNNTITGNSGWQGDCGGVHIDYGATATLVNNIVAFNTSGIYLYTATLTARNNDVYGNTAYNYRGTTDLTGTNGNISRDPALSSTYHDAHLQPGSPCIDAGDDYVVKPGDTDVYGKRRTIGQHVDIGADESDGTARTVPSRIWMVTQSGDDLNSGDGWGSAKQTVSGALMQAQGGDEVWVARGVYVESVTLPAGVELYGGFRGTEAQRSARDWKANPTILDAGGKPTVVSVPFQGGVVDGFTIRNANGYDGGGLFVTGTARISNNTVTANSAYYGGGGIFVGGMATICNNTIAANNTPGQGGGVDVHSGGSATISDNIITSNSAASGGGIYIADGGRAAVSNNTIIGNTGSGGGVRLAYGTATLVNNIVAFNSSGIGSYSATLTVLNNDVFGNKGDYAGLPNPTGTNGNISADPLFADRAGADFHLLGGSPCIDAGDDSMVTAGETDFEGNPRIRGVHADIGACERVAASPTAMVWLGASITAPPVAVEGVVYTGGNDGKLYAFSEPLLGPIPGFPVDISAAVGTSVSLNTRPAVYYGKAGKAIYLTTNVGHVVKVWPDGKVAWVAKPLNGPTMSTPAVTPDGNVYVTLGLGTTSVASYLFQLDEVTGQAKYISPYLGSSPATALLDRSAAIDQRYAYINASGNVLGSLAVLNQDNLTVRATFAPGEDALPPFLNGRNIYVATRSGAVYKVNATTMNPDMAFGESGTVKVGEGVTAGPFLYSTGVVYVGTASGRIWKLDGATGAKTLFVDTGTNSAITGLLITRGTAAFSTASGTMQQVSLADPTVRSVETLAGTPAGGPVYDAAQDRYVIATTTGRVYSVPAR